MASLRLSAWSPGSPCRPPSRTTPDWVITPRFAAPRPRRRAAVLRRIVSVLSYHVFSRAFAYESVVWSVRCRRWKPMTRRSAYWCAVRSLAKWYPCRCAKIVQSFHKDFLTPTLFKGGPFLVWKHYTVGHPSSLRDTAVVVTGRTPCDGIKEKKTSDES